MKITMKIIIGLMLCMLIAGVLAGDDDDYDHDHDDYDHDHDSKCPDYCNGVCVNKQTDINNCGYCDKMCPAPTHGIATCCGGMCGFYCDNEYSRCGDLCVDEQIDPNNCGACGNKCPSGQTCSSGMCTCSPCSTSGCQCPPDQTCTSGTCVCHSGCSTNCPCPTGQSCNAAGTCSSECPPSASPCDIGCYNVCPNGQDSADTCPAGPAGDGAVCETGSMMINPGPSGCEMFCTSGATCPSSSTVNYFSLQHITGQNEGYICRCYTSIPSTKEINTSPGGSGCPGHRGILSTGGGSGNPRNTEEMYQI